MHGRPPADFSLLHGTPYHSEREPKPEHGRPKERPRDKYDAMWDRVPPKQRAALRSQYEAKR